MKAVRSARPGTVGVVGSLAGSRLLRHVVSLGGAVFGVALVKMLLAGYVAQLHGANAFGTFAVALAYAQLGGVFFDFGLAEWAVYSGSSGKLADARARARRIFLGLGTIVGATALVLSPLIIAGAESRLLVPALLVVVWAQAGQALAQTLLRAAYKIGVAARLRALQLLANVGVLVAGWVLALPMGALLAAVAGAELLVLVGFAVAVARVDDGADRAPSAERACALTPFAISAVAIYLYTTSDALLLSLYRPSAEVGQYTAGYRIYLLALQVGGLMVGAALPMLYSVGGGAGRRAAFSAASNAQISATFALCALIIGFSSTATALVYGSGFDTASVVLVWLAISVAVKGVGVVPAALLTAAGHQRLRTCVQVGVALLNVALNLALIPVYGLWAAVAVTLISDLLLTACYCAVVLRLADRVLDWSDMIRFGYVVVSIAGLVLLHRSDTFSIAAWSMISICLWIPLVPRAATSLADLGRRFARGEAGGHRSLPQPRSA